MTNKIYPQTVLTNKHSITPPIIYIISLFLIFREHIFLFNRDDNMVGPVSGKIETGESYADAAVRELIEETNIHLRPLQIHQAHHFFLAISPKGKIVFGKTLYAILCAKTFEPSQIRLNSELFDYEINSFRPGYPKNIQIWTS